MPERYPSFWGLLIAAVIYFGFRDDVYKKVYGPEHDRGQLPLPEGMSGEEAVDRIRRGFANPDVEQVTDTADAVILDSLPSAFAKNSESVI